MKIGELENSLKKDYDLIAFVDLADLREQHRAVFDLFKTVRKDVFENKQRIVLYSQHKPEDKFLQHILNAAKLVDIGEFFILVICPYKLNTSLQSLVIDIEKTKNFGQPKYVVSDSLCPLPFTHQTADQFNNLKPCCKFIGKTGKWQNRSLDEEFKNEAMQEIRDQMIRGEYPAGCSKCWHIEATGGTSNRKNALVRYEKILYEYLDNFAIREIEWSPTRLCNFKCRICRSDASTSIAAEELKFTKDANYREVLKDFLHQEKNNDNLLRIQQLTDLEELESLHILGGEPFMWQNLETCLDLLIESNRSKNIQLLINTNGSHWQDSIINKIINNFKGIEFVISLDDVGERFEITRGSNWDLIEDNLKKFSNLQSERFKVTLAVTINLLNVLYLQSVIDLADKFSFNITWIYLEDPDFLCIDNATSKTVQIVQEMYKNHTNSELKSIAHRMFISKPSDGKKFVDYSDMLDIRRKQNFKETHKEIYKAMSINTLL